MSYEQIILSINIASISVLLLLTFIMLAATRFKGENGYAAAIIVVPNIPVYLYNMSRMLGWHGVTLAMFPISYSVNTMLMPLLWLFTLKNYKPGFRFRAWYLLHFLPAAISLVMCLAISAEGRMEAIVHEMSGEDTWVGDINTIIIIAQLVIYFPMIFRYIRRRKKEVGETLSDAEWAQKEWIPTLMALFAALFVAVMACYVIWPRTDAWLIQILNIVAMVYLVYNAIAHPAVPAMQPEKAEPATSAVSTLSMEQMQEICDRAASHLIATKSYLNPEITLALLAKEMLVPSRTLSRSINAYLNRNFFEFINEMRVDEAKRRLLELRTADYNIDSIYAECGFRSRSTFFLVFKKTTGLSPAAWLKEQQGSE